MSESQLSCPGGSFPAGFCEGVQIADTGFIRIGVIAVANVIPMATNAKIILIFIVSLA